jgi:ATP-dependent DNA helicase MPH1
MFHTLLLEISGGQTANGKKSGTKGGANAMRNNSEFRKLLGDVEAEMNCIRIGKGGKTKASRHPKMEKALELVRHWSSVLARTDPAFAAAGAFRSGRRG